MKTVIKVKLLNGTIIELTNAQKDVYDLKLIGLSNLEIAKKLDISANSVQKRLKRIGKKSPNPFNKDIEFEDDDPEIDFLKESNRYLKTQLRKYKKQHSIENEILDLFKNGLKKYPNHKNFSTKKNNNQKMSDELVIMLSDIHAGEIVKSESTVGLNEYNMKIMEQRMKNIFNNANSIINDSNCNFKKLNVFLLGDIVSGIIHNELKEGISMIDQVYVTASVIAEMIYKWSTMFSHVDVSCVVGNHGRLDKPVVFKNKHDNFDGFVYHAIKIHLKNVKNVHIEIPKCPWLVKKIEGHTFLLTHGDSRVPGYNGISYYKLDKMDSNASKTFSNILNIKIDNICVAHYHVPATLGRIGGGKILVNGCVIGTGDFALYAMNMGTTPTQRMFKVHKKYGIYHETDIRVLD